MKKHLPLLLTLAALAAAIVFSAEAAEGARQGLRVCAQSLAPSLFPLFVLSGLLSSLGLPGLLSRALGGVMRRLFHVSGAGAQAFFIGICGGYPLGAAAVARLRRDGRVSKDEAERLLAFCNNSGPAFIVGAAGGVFHSAGAGLLLYAAHVLAAVCAGLLLRGGPVPDAPPAPAEKGENPPAFAGALTRAVSSALDATLSVCGYVTLFSALLGLLAGPLAALPPLAGALVRGFFELGGGIAAMAGVAPTPASLAAAALILGWGGLSVHCQTLGVLAGTDIKSARHLAGRALCGLLAAVFTYLPALALF